MAQPYTKPRALKYGDKIGLVCPASRPEGPMAVNRASWLIERAGYHPVVGESVLACDGFLAGDDMKRFEDLDRFIKDPTVRAIYCLSGGYGSLRLLDKIDYRAIALTPKIFIGSEENTSLLLAINARARLVVVHAPNLDKLTNLKSVKNVLQFCANMKNPSPLVTAGFEEDGMGAVGTYAYAPVAGVTEGICLGGNLTALGSLMGTPFQPDFNESILLLEDADEKRDILERWFTNLYLAGALQSTNAICLGKFERCDPRGLKNSISIEEQISTRLRELNKISCFDFLFGQGGQFGATALGVRARLETAKGKIEFLEPAFSLA